LFDVLVIGSGLAGLSAALEARKSGLSVAVMTKNNPFRSNSSLASGGINAALGIAQSDSPKEHALDTIKGAAGLGDERAIQILTENAPKTVLELERLGAGFDKNSDGAMAQRSFGGSGRKRTCYVQDKTGASIVQALMRACNEAGAQTLSGHYLLSLLVSGRRICGAVVLRQADSEVIAIEAKSVVLSGGGFAGIYYGHTTNPTSTSGDLLAAAFRAGLRLVNMEFVQFHPTGLAGSGELISEAARSEGGHLIIENGQRFTDELQTRDRLARAIKKAIDDGHKVFIDVRHLDKDVVLAKLPNFCKAAAAKLGLDATSEPVPIEPSAHYTMGGIEVDRNTKTAIAGLFACGECAVNGVHGANRLGGNSLLEAALFGAIAGKNAASFARWAKPTAYDHHLVEIERAKVDYIMQGDNRFNLNALRKSLGEKLMQKLGIFRDNSSIQDAFEYVEYLLTLTSGLHCIDKTRNNNVEVVMILEFINALELAEITAFCALKRKESRGAHFRSDYPLENSHYRKNSYTSRKSSGFFDLQFIKPRSFEWYLAALRRSLIG
jgi:succinate dehydrogenase / fumarate reductase flavoprotein subunit